SVRCPARRWRCCPTLRMPRARGAGRARTARAQAGSGGVERACALLCQSEAAAIPAALLTWSPPCLKKGLERWRNFVKPPGGQGSASAAREAPAGPRAGVHRGQPDRRQLQRQTRAATGVVVRADAAAVGLGDLANDRQP